MAVLYEIAAEYRSLFDSLEEMEENSDDISIEEIGQAWFDTLEGMETELSGKAENLIKYIKNISAEADAVKAEEDRLKKRRKSKENRIVSLKNYLMNCLEISGCKKFETACGVISVRNNAESVDITDENAFIGWAELHERDELLRYKTPEINKTAVKKALNDGENIPGARLAKSKSLIIK